MQCISTVTHMPCLCTEDSCSISAIFPHPYTFSHIRFSGVPLTLILNTHTFPALLHFGISQQLVNQSLVTSCSCAFFHFTRYYT
jgi:hypothetical protein